MAEQDRIVSPEKIGEDAVHLDHSLRPRLLDDFIGQHSIRSNLKIFTESAKARKKSMDHVLFYGPPGLGKTTLAQIIGHELEVNTKITSGPTITRAGDLAAIITNLSPYDVLFIDEIHRISANIEEVLYSAMEDFALDIMIGEGVTARSMRIDLPPFTLVGATTRLGLLTTPLRDRFGILCRLEFYSEHDVVKIVNRNAHLLDIPITPEGSFEIAKRSRGTPRVAGRLLRRVADFAIVEDNGIISQSVACSALDRLSIDSYGLDSQDQRYLNCMVENYGGAPVGVDTIAATLSESRDTIEDVVEPFLIQQGFIQKTPRGRMITDKGWRHLGLQSPVSLHHVKNPLQSPFPLSDKTEPDKSTDNANNKTSE